MPDADAARERARATWAAGDWDAVADALRPIGEAVLERAALAPRMEVLDVGTGSGGTIAIPAALRGAFVVGVDITPELLVHAQRRADAAGAGVQWIEADAEALPFSDASFDRVISTFGAMFAPDQRRAASELVRVCRDGGMVLTTSWPPTAFAGDLFALSGSYLPPSPEGVLTPAQWGDEAHVEELFAAAGARAEIERRSALLEFPSRESAVHHYTESFGPIVMLRRKIEPEGRWREFRDAFARLVARHDRGDASAQLAVDYLLVTVRL